MDGLDKLQEQVNALEKRVRLLEDIARGSSPGRPGRKPKLSPEQKKEIIEKHNAGVSYTKLAGEYHVCRSTICSVCQNQKRDTRMTIPISIVGKDS